MNDNHGQYCFTHDGEDVFLFTLQNSYGTIVTITNYGAIISSFSILLQDGARNDIVLGFDTIADYLSKDYLGQYPWFGAAIGRCANRIKDARFIVDDKTYELTRNSGHDQLHGGKSGFDRRVWRFEGQGTSPCAWLELSYHSPDAEEGYPGNLDVTIRFELEDNNDLSYIYQASSDQPTPVDLTHHSYFNLGNGHGTILEHDLRICSHEILEQDINLVTTGNIMPIENTAFDFSNFKRIGKERDRINEFDKSFIVDHQWHGLVAEARSVKAGILLQVYSDQPIVHFYSGKWIPAVNGKHGNHYGPFSGFCLETHRHPNAVNIPHFPNIILQPGENYYQKTTYRVLTSPSGAIVNC